MTIQDDGKGFDNHTPKKRIGFMNIQNGPNRYRAVSGLPQPRVRAARSLLLFPFPESRINATFTNYP